MKLNSIIENIKIRPKAILLFGPPYSGKTKWLEEYIKKNKYSDFINLNISEYKTPKDRSKSLDKCLEDKNNFIIEGIALKNDRIDSLLNKLNENNYRIYAAYINRDLEELLENIEDISKYNIKKIYYKIEDIIKEIKDKVDKVIEVE